MTSPQRIAVVGAGIAGLAAAHRLQELAAAEKRMIEIIVLEAGPRAGGSIDTIVEGGYRIDTGGDMFITDKPWALRLCQRLGLGERLLSPDERYRRSLVLRAGKPAPVPEGFVLMTPSRLLPMATTPILSLRGKARAALDLVLPRGREADESLGGFVRRRFGRELLERLVQPLVGGIYTADPDKLSLRATLPRFLEMERAHRSLVLAALRAPQRSNGSGARYGLFVSLPGGLSELVEALTRRVSVRTGAKVRALSRDGADWVLELADETVRCDAVIVALPAYAAAPLLRPHAPAAAIDLGAIDYASTAVVVSGHRFADVAHPLDAFGLVVPAIERREVLAVSMASRKLPGRAPDGEVQLRTFVGGALQPELLARSDEAIAASVRCELGDIFGVGGRERFLRVFRHERSMPQYHVGHLERVAAIEAAIAPLPTLGLCGNAYRGVGIPDCVHSGELAAERVFSALRPASPRG